MTRWPVILDITTTHLRSRVKQSSIAALGVTFGIGAFIILVSFMTGLNNLLDGLILNRTAHIKVYNEMKPSVDQPIDHVKEFENNTNAVYNIKPKKSQPQIHNVKALIEEISRDPRVKGIAPQTSAKVFYLSGGIQLNGAINGIDVDEEVRLYNFDEYVVRGNYQDIKRTANGIFLGKGLAEKMSLEPGDRVQVNTAEGGMVSLKIIGYFQSGLADIDNVQSYVSIETAQQLMGKGNNFITDLHVKLHDINESAAMAQEISKQYKLSALDIHTANAQFETGTFIRNLITYAVSITLLIVAGFGIYNILNMMIYEKMNDIAILKAMGFRGKDVRKIFVSQAMVIGLIGGVLGLIIGYVVSVIIDNTPFRTKALHTITTFPVNFDSKYYIIGIVFALISTFLAGYLPAKKAQKIDPVDIIRGQ
jgi:lipoprotein-releasing system permease protein